MRPLRATSRTAVGRGLVVVGALLLAGVGVRYAIGAVRADRARQAWDESHAQAQVAAARASVMDVRFADAAVPGAAIARVRASKIHLDAIVFEGVSDDELNAGPGHFPGSALPGEAGNAVISAHRDRHFNRLDELLVGDTLTTESGLRTTSWIIVSKRVIDKDAPALFRTADATLTLTTCWPIRYLGTAPERLIVTAKPIAIQARTQS